MKKKKSIKKGYQVSPSHASQSRIFGQTGAYLMGSVLYPFKNKWGISDATKLRRAQVDNDVAGSVYTVFGREIIYGWLCEQFVHFIYQFQNAPMKKGTGRTEWYYTINPIFGTFFLWHSWDGVIELSFRSWSYSISVDWYWNVLAYVCPFIWIEGFIWLVVFRFLGWCLAGALLYLIIFTLKYNS